MITRTQLTQAIFMATSQDGDAAPVVMVSTPDGTPMAIKSVTVEPASEDIGPSTIWLHVEEI